MINMIIIMIISFIIESIVPNIIREFIPFFVIAGIIITALLKIDPKKYYLTLFIFGFIYDHYFMNTIVLNAFMFMFIGYVAKAILNKNVSLFKMIFCYYLMIAAYTSLMVLITLGYIKRDYVYLLIKLLNSLFLNSVYFLILYFIYYGISHIFKKHSYF